MIGCVVFEHETFGGGSRNVQPGTRLKYVGSLNDKVSSIACTTGCSMTGYEHNDFGGDWHFWRGNISYVGDGWNDRISSFTVECSAARPSNQPGKGSSDVLVPQESTGPSPFGTSEPSSKDLGIVTKPRKGVSDLLKDMKP
jgi:hypothetical protein